MVRGKTQIKRIENTSSRQVTFSKRRSGLLKKAFELSVLCDAEVALIVFSPTGKLYEFSSSSTNQTIERYKKNAKNLGTTRKEADENMEHMMKEAAAIVHKIELIEESKRHLLGYGLESRSTDELQQIEGQLERSLNKIRTRKRELFKEKIEEMKMKEAILERENADLRKKLEYEVQLFMQPSMAHQEVPQTQKENEDVETQLAIGLPERRTTH